jgi:glucosamine--fructose-6-phosphate aminotransferase (isomerizing)
MKTGHFTREEIHSQPEAWQDALAVIEKSSKALKKIVADDYTQVVFTGCGSTYYLSLAAAALFQQMTGRPARAVPGGELLLNPQVSLTDEKTLLVAVSRSGSTTETVNVVEQFKKERRGPVIAITNYGDQPLAGLADVPVVIEKGQEQSVAQTRSFASMYVAATALTTLAAGREDLRKSMEGLPNCGVKLIATYESLAREIGEDLNLDRFYFLGSGSRYGLACEVNLKMKEMTLTHSEPFHFLEFRHGPMSMVTDTAVVIGLLSDSQREHEQKVLDEMTALGGHVASLGETNTLVAFQSGIAESVRGVLYLPVLQMMAYFRSIKKGLNPDRPNHLTAVVTLSLP